MVLYWKVGLILTCSIALYGCDLDEKINGSGSSGNLAPTAFVGNDIDVLEGETVTLGGSGADDDGTISHIFWAQESGPAVTLSDSTSTKPSFTAPDLDAGEEVDIVFRLTVIDDDSESASNTVSVHVSSKLGRPSYVNAYSRNNGIYLNWEANEAETYEIYYATESFASLSSLDNFSVLADAAYIGGISSSQHTITGLENGKDYFAVIVGVNGNIKSAPSQEVSVAAVKQTVSVSAPLNDTGAIRAGDFVYDNYFGCSNEMAMQQDCGQGRDAETRVGTLTKTGQGRSGFDFSRLNSDGSLYRGNGNFNLHPWACVRDNVTGLIWEVKNNNYRNAHYRYKQYRWGGFTANGRDQEDRQGEYYDDWNDLVRTSINEKLCGRVDWRVPTVGELEGLIDVSFETGSQIDPDYFPSVGNYAPYSNYWTASPYIKQVDSAWVVSFSNSVGKTTSKRNSRYSSQVRLVSGN